jgi:hypothetical protein
LNHSSPRSCRLGTGCLHSHWRCRSWGSFHNLSLGYVSVRSISFCFQESVSNCWIRIGSRTNLQCIFPGKALLAVPTWERFHSQMDPLMSLQIVVTIERLWTLVTFERSVILLLLLSRVVAVHWSTHLMRRILHVHSTYKCHLVSWAVHIRHDRASHRRKRVPTVRWPGVVALRCCH